MPLATLRKTRSAQNWTDRHVTAMGLGRHGGGLGAARYLAQQGARVTISDTANADVLSESLAQLADVAVHALHLGGHDERDFRAAEVVVVNPAVRPDHPCLQIARTAGAELTSEIELFLQRCGARAIGVSGSNGKSTTVTMLAEMLRAGGHRTWLGGNIGGSLLGELDRMTAEDWVVLELSSFQLAHLTAVARLPEIAVLTNCTPNHLDWHGTQAEYAAAKRRLLDCSSVICNLHDPVVTSWQRDCKRVARSGWDLDRIPRLLVPGEHNRQNAACAAAAAEAAGISPGVIRQRLAEYRGLPYRIECVCQVRGRTFYNDSKATSPGATIAALAAVEGPVWLLAGGAAKGTCFDKLAATAAKRTRGIAVFGQARNRLQASIAACDRNHPLHAGETMEEALAWCYENSAPGESVLLSPACASFDQFRDFEDRGRRFVQLVDQLR